MVAAVMMVKGCNKPDQFANRLERRRLGAAFSLQSFHDALLWGGSLPVSFHRRALHGEGAAPHHTRTCIEGPVFDASRIVWGSLAGH